MNPPAPPPGQIGIGGIRAARTELNVPPAAPLALYQHGADPRTRGWLVRHADAIRRLARIGELVVEEQAVPAQSLVLVVDEATFALPVHGVIDLAAETARLRREIARLEGEIARGRDKLARPDFVARAPAEVVEQQRERLVEAEATCARLQQALQRIG